MAQQWTHHLEFEETEKMDDRDLRPRHHRNPRLERVENAIITTVVVVLSALLYWPQVWAFLAWILDWVR